MAGSFISIDVNARPVLDALGSLLDAGRDAQPAFADIGEHLTNTTKDRIIDGGPAPDGTPWEPLSEAYAKRKPRNRDKILILNRYLLSSIHPEPAADGVAVGTNMIYAATHQFGAPERGIPARPFLGLSGADERAVVDILQEHLARAVRRS